MKYKTVKNLTKLCVAAFLPLSVWAVPYTDSSARGMCSVDGIAWRFYAHTDSSVTIRGWSSYYDGGQKVIGGYDTGYFGKYSAIPIATTGSVTVPYLVNHRGTKIGVDHIGAYAFCCCSNVTEVIIPYGVESVQDDAFLYCSSLTNVVIPNSVTSIGAYVFAYCDNIDSVTLPSSVKSIGGAAFYRCSGLTSVTIPDSVTSIADSLFRDCWNLTNVTIASGVKSIGTYAFYRCRGLNDFSLLDNISSIGGHAFEGCTGLADVAISNVKSIEPYTFASCENLTNVIISACVTNIGDFAFSDCGRLEQVVFLSAHRPAISMTAFANDVHACIKVPFGVVGWDVDIPGTWNDCKIDYIDPVIFFMGNGGDIVGDDLLVTRRGAITNKLPIAALKGYILKVGGRLAKAVRELTRTHISMKA